MIYPERTPERAALEEKLKTLPIQVRSKFIGKTVDEQIEMIKEEEAKMTKGTQLTIQLFVSTQLAKGKTKREVKRMVKDKFGIVII